MVLINHIPFLTNQEFINYPLIQNYQILDTKVQTINQIKETFYIKDKLLILKLSSSNEIPVNSPDD